MAFVTLGEMVGWGRGSAAVGGRASPKTRGDGCTGKRRFESYAKAEAGIGGLYQKRIARVQQGVPAPYACGYCHGWHIGHS